MFTTLKHIVRNVCPPPIWHMLGSMKRGRSPFRDAPSQVSPDVAAGKRQDLDVYWTPEMAEILDHWGETNTWIDVQLLMANLNGKILDIACGTGIVMKLLDRPSVDLYGCDISDLLIDKAINRGIPREKLIVCDATDMPYSDNEFDYSYSIGSLEHFTEDGIEKFIRESARVTRIASFHMIPTSRSEREEGWLKSIQSYHNNSVSWWMSRFKRGFPQVRVVDSTWTAPISVGKWILCYKSSS